MKSVIFKDYSFNYLNQKKRKAIENLNLEIESGSVVGVIGKAGAGKSTLLKALDGLVPQVEVGYQDGDVIVDGENVKDHEVNQMARHVGLVLQNPEIQIFSLTVWDDIAFGPANLGVPREEIVRRVEAAMEKTELTAMAHRSPNNLSGGEQQLLAIAGLLAMEPSSVLAFDEPVSMLDPIGKELVFNVMRNVCKDTRCTSITTESGADIEAVAEVVDHVIAIDEGKLILSGSPEEVFQSELVEEIGVGRPQVTELVLMLKKRGIEFERVPITLTQAYELMANKLREAGIKKIDPLPSRDLRNHREFGETVIEVENVHHFYNPAVHALRGVSFTVPKGQIVGIIGQNGSGKTTLAKHLVGLLKPTNKDAVVKIMGKDITSKKMRFDEIIKMINYVFQNPDDQLFAETAWEEVAFAPEMMDLDKEDIKRLTKEAMDVFDLMPYRNRYVYGLDEDLKTYLSIACVLPLHPDILLIDEPTTGLDTKGEVKMMESLRYLRDELGKTIIIITHNMKTVGNHCDRVLVASKGNIILDDTPRKVFAETEKLLEADIRPPQVTRLGQMLHEEFGCPMDILTVDEMADTLEACFNPGKEESSHDN